MSSLKVGTVEDGYYYKGGDPSSKDSWVELTPAMQAKEAAINLAAPIEAGQSMVTGMAGQALGGLGGIAGSVLPGPQGQGADWTRKISNALTYEPRGKLAQSILNVASLPGEAVGKVSDAVGERGAETSPLLGAIGKTSVEALPLLLGARAMKAKPALTADEQAVAAARDAGFKMTPEEMNAPRPFKALASIAGEPRLARLVSKKNQPVVNEKIAADLGLPKTTPIDLDTLRQVRSQAGKEYEAVRGLGKVTTDATYASDLDALAAKYKSAAQDFPELAKADVEKVVDGLRKGSFDSNSAVDMISQLREGAASAFAKQENGLGKVMKGGADAIEGQLERHLAASGGNADQIANFRKARSLIAKTYTAEKALVGEDINPRVYAKEAGKGKLTGGAKEVGDFASNFERSSQKPNHQATGTTLGDALMPLIGGTAQELPLMFARPAARSILSSDPAQYLMDPRRNISRPIIRSGILSALPEEN